MKVLAGRYLNEIVGITVMLLMTVALIAGQTDARSQGNTSNDEAFGRGIEIELKLGDEVSELIFRHRGE